MNLIKGKERERHYSRKTLLLNPEEKYSFSEKLVAVRQITCKTTKFLGLSPIPEFIQKHFLMKLEEESFNFAILNPPIKIIRTMFNHVNFL